MNGLHYRTNVRIEDGDGSVKSLVKFIWSFTHETAALLKSAVVMGIPFIPFIHLPASKKR